MLESAIWRRAAPAVPGAAVAVLLSLTALSVAHAAVPVGGLAAAAVPDRSSSRPSALAYLTQTASSPPLVWAAGAGGRERRRLGPGTQPLIAPNGGSVAAGLFGATADSERGPAIAIYSTIGGATLTYLSLESATATPLAWSPDSRYVAVAQQSTATTNIAAGSGLDVIDVQTGTVVSIAKGLIYGASFARDGSDRVVFALSHSISPFASSNLYVSNPDGSALRPLSSDGRSLNPVWGPRYIAYDRERLRGQQAPAYQIWLASPARAAIRRVTNVPAGPLVSGLVPLAFSASGARLLAEFEGQDTSNAWAVTVSSGRARMLRVRGRTVQGAGISLDGRTLLIDENAFEEPSSSGRVASVPFAGGRSKVLIAHGSQASWNG